MGTPFLQTERLVLDLESTAAVLARIAAMPPAEQAEISPDWLARLRAAAAPSPWTHGFALVERASGVVVGSCAFKGPPDAVGVTEIAYGLATEYQGHGYAREAARARATTRSAPAVRGACARTRVRTTWPRSAY